MGDRPPDTEFAVVRCSVKEGDIIHREGRKYRVLNVSMGDYPTSLRLRVKNIVGRGREEFMRLPIISEHDPEYPSPEYSEYYQITGFSEDEDINKWVVTLKTTEFSFSTAGQMKKIGVTWEEMREIKAALEKKEQEVFCTLVKIMGKEILGNIKILPKDPPILRMAALVMDKILSFLDDSDLLNCRLVTSTLAFDVLPICRIRSCPSIQIGHEGVETTLQPILPVHFKPNPTVQRVQPRLTFPNLEELYHAGLLQSTKCVKLYNLPSDAADDAKLCELPAVDTIVVDLRRYINYNQSLPPGPSRRNVHVDDWDLPIIAPAKPSIIAIDPKLWNMLAEMVKKHSNSLTVLKICNDGTEGMKSDNSWMDLKMVSGCIMLNELVVTFGESGLVKNVKAIPYSVTKLELSKLKKPLTKDEVEWITHNLTNLTKVTIDVLYSPGGNGIEDVGQDTVLQLLRIPSLQFARLHFHVVEAKGCFSVCPTFIAMGNFFKTIMTGKGGWLYTPEFTLMGQIMDVMVFNRSSVIGDDWGEELEDW